MDVISYSLADKQKQRIEKFIENPDSESGLLTTPNKIESGEVITVPNGRIATLPDLDIEGELIINGDVFVPSGSKINATSFTLQADNLSKWRITVSNTGELITTQVI